MLQHPRPPEQHVVPVRLDRQPLLPRHARVGHGRLPLRRRLPREHRLLGDAGAGEQEAVGGDDLVAGAVAAGAADADDVPREERLARHVRLPLAVAVLFVFVRCALWLCCDVIGTMDGWID